MKVISLHECPEIGVSHNPEIKKQEMIGNGEIPALTNLSVARFAPGQQADSHSHADKYEIFFVQSGVGKLRINGKETEFKQGICAVAEPGEAHEIKNTGQSDLVLLYFGIEADSEKISL